MPLCCVCHMATFLTSYSELTMGGVQGAVQWLTDLQSALTTVQALIVILTLVKWAAIASAIPRFNHLLGAACLLTLRNER